jgi:hypothetical protein
LYLACFSFYLHINEEKNLRTTNLFDLLIYWKDGKASLLSIYIYIYIWGWYIAWPPLVGCARLKMVHYRHAFLLFSDCCECVLNLALCVCGRNDATTSSVIMLYMRVDSCDFHFFLSLDRIFFEWIKKKKKLLYTKQIENW